MAHDCQFCGCICRCGGDIDDIHFGEERDCVDGCRPCSQRNIDTEEDGERE